MEPNDDESRNALAPLQVDRTGSCYRLGPGASERMAVMAPGHALREIDRVEINRFVERQGVTYYILEVYLKKERKKKATRDAPRVVGFSTEDAAEGDDVLIDVDLNATPNLELERRFRDFEGLRNKLSVSFENLHPGFCSYCDTFIDFLATSTVQPGLFTKLTTRPPQRKAILSNFMNKTIQLAVPRTMREAAMSGDVGVAPPAHCDGWSIIPQVVESFLRDPIQQ